MKLRLSTIVGLILSSLLFLGVSNFAFSAPTPSVISYQGFLTSATGTAQTGTTTITLRIYDAATGGTLLFEEVHPTIGINNGYFSLAIGSVGDVNGGTSASSITDLTFDRSYYVTVELDTPFSTGEMTLAGGTRAQLGTVPFANVAYGTLQATSSTGLLTQKGRMYFNTADNQLYVYDGSSWNALGISGSGITSLNGLTGISQTFALSTAGTDISLTSTGTTHTLAIPDAGVASRGVVSTTTQTFAGEKYFENNLTVGTTTSRGVFTLGVTAPVSATGLYGALLDLTGEVTGTTSNIIGVNLNPKLSISGSSGIGFRVNPIISPVTNISTMYGTANFITVDGTSTITNLYSNLVRLDTASTFSGGITNGTALYVGAGVLSGPAKPTTMYGLRIANQGSSGISTSYGLYVDSQANASTSYAAIFAGGNIGIGTTTPTSTLSIRGSGSTTPFSVASSTGSTLFAILTNGNVGIGTSTPGSLLSVQGSSYFGGNLTATGTLTITGQSSLTTASATSLSVSGQTYLTNASATNFTTTGDAYFNNASTTVGTIASLFSTNASTTNLSGTGLSFTSGFISALTLVNASTTNLTVSGQTYLTNASSSAGITASTFYGALIGSTASLSSTLSVAGQSSLANASTSNLTTTNLYATGTLAVSGQTTLSTASATALTASTLYATTASTTSLTSGMLYFTNASSTGALTLASLFGASLSSCNASTEKLLWSNGTFSCGTDAGGSGGTITSLNGSSVASQTLATSTLSTVGLDLLITSSTTNGVHTFSLTPQAGYSIPLTASSSNWNSFFNSPVSYLTQGANLLFLGTSTIALNPDLSITSLTTGSTTITGTSTLATTTASTLTVSGQTFLQSLLTLTNASSSGGITATTFYGALLGTASLSTLDVTGQSSLSNASTSNLSTTNLYATGTLSVSGQATLTTASATALTATTIYGTDSVIDNSTSTNFFATLLNAVTAVITNLTATNATATNLVTTNSTSTNSFVSSLVATLANITDLVVGNSTTTNAVITNATIANATATNLGATNANITNGDITNLTTVNSTTTGSSVVTGTSTLATTTVASLTVTGQTTLNTASATSLTVSGQTYLANASSTGGLTLAQTLNVTGQTTLGNASATALTATTLYTTNLSFTNASSTNQTISNNLYLSGLTTGSIPFIGTGGLVSQDNTNFFWDNTNDRLGIGSSSPIATLSVRGAGATNPFVVASSTGTVLLSVSQTGLTTLSTASTTGAATIGGQLFFANASSTGGLTLAQTLNVAGQTTLTTASATALTVSGQTVLNTSSTTGAATIGGQLFFANASSTGGLTLAQTLNVAGKTTLANASGTALTLSGNLNVAGQSTLATASATALTVSGQTVLNTSSTTGAATIGGQLFFANASSTGGLTLAQTLNVAGQTTLTTASATGITSTNIYGTNGVITNATATNLFATEANFTNATSSTFFATLLSAVTAIITDLTATNATATNLVTTNSTSTNSFISSLVATLANITDLVVGNSTTTNAVITNATATNLLTSSLITLGTTTLAMNEGNVGVGTTSPVSRLDVWGNLNISTSSTPTLFADTSLSRVGIGTNVPVSALHVDQSASGVIAKFGSSGSVTGVGSILISRSTTVTSNNIGVRIDADRTNAGGSGTSDFVINQSLATTMTERLRIKGDSGNIGIGTSSPISTFSLTGTAGTNPLTIASSTGASLFSVNQAGLTTLSTASTTGAATIGGQLFFANASSTGGLTLAQTLNVAGKTTLANASGTALTLSGNLNVAGQSVLTTSSTTGAATIGGQLFFASASSTGGLTLAQTLNVTGQTTLTTASATALTVSGQTVLNTSSTTVGTVTTLFSTLPPRTNASTTNITTSGNLYLSGLTTGSIPFIGTNGLVSQNNANFFWDNTNTRLGIGSSSPIATLSVRGVAGANPFVVASSTGATLFSVNQSGLATLSTASTTGAATIGGQLFFASASSTGGLTLAQTLNVTGQTTLTTASATALTLSGNLNVAGQSTLATASATALTVSGQSVFNTSSTTVGTVTTLFSTLATITNASTTNVTTSGNLYLSGLTTGSIPFIGTNGLVSQDNSNFFWDNTNDRLGIGSSSPIATLSVRGAGSTNPFVVASSTGATLFSVNQSGLATLSTASTTGAATIGGQLFFANASSTGGLTLAQTLNVAGLTTLSTASTTGAATIGGQLFFANASSTGGLTLAQTLNVAGQTSLGNASGTALTLSGNLNVAGQSTLATASSTGLTATNLYATNSTITNASTTNLSATGATLTNLFSSVLNAVTAAFTTLTTTGTTTLATTGGNVGVGLTTPSAKLHVGGDIGLPYGNAIRVSPENALAWVSGTTKLVETGWNGATDFVSYYTPGSVRSSPILTTLATGNVGIGTTTPGSNLTVSGDAFLYAPNPIITLASPNSSWVLQNVNGAQFRILEGGTSERFTIGYGGNVGIGSSTPGAKLSVQGGGYFGGNLVATGTLTVSGTSTFAVSQGNVGIGTANPGSKLTVTANLTDTSGFIFGSNVGVLANPSGPSTASFYGSLMQVISTGSNISSTNGIYAAIADSVHSTTSSIGSVSGFYSRIQNSLGGTIINGRGVESVILNAATGTISNASGIFIHTPLNASGTLSNTFGLYINSQTAGTQTNAPFAIYQAGTSDKNYFAGSVGIGTTTPTARLAVTGSTTGVALIGDNGFGTFAGISLNGTLNTTDYNFTSSVGDKNLYINRPAGFETVFREANGTTNMIIKSGGNVGIGTTTPSSRLHVANGNSGVVPAAGTVLTVDSSGNNFLALLTPSANAGGITFGNLLSNVDGGIYYNGVSSRGLDFRTAGNATKMVIDANGNVGIGTTTPGSKLSVQGDTFIGGNIIGTGTLNIAGLSTFTSASATALTVTGQTVLGNASATALTATSLVATNATSTSFYATVLQAVTALFTTLTTSGTSTLATGGGNVGIGTTTPGSKLTVTGTTTLYGSTSGPTALKVVGNIDNTAATATSLISIGATSTNSTPRGVAVSGKYVYLVSQSASTLQVIDVSQPNLPNIVGGTTTRSTPYDVAISGGYAYVVSKFGSSLQVINISNPALPQVVGVVTTASEPIAVAVSGNYAYVASYAGSTGRSVQAIDISNPLNPTVVSTLSFTGIAFTGIAIEGSYAYLSAEGTDSLYIVNISTPTSLTLTSVTSVGGINPADVVVSGRYAYVVTSNSASLKVVDVSNKLVPVVVSTTTLTGYASQITIAGKYAFITESSPNTLEMVDISNPLQPISVATKGLPGFAWGVAVSGRYIYAGNGGGSSGLNIYDTGGLETTSAIIHSLEAGTAQIRNDLTVQGGIFTSALNAANAMIENLSAKIASFTTAVIGQAQTAAQAITSNALLTLNLTSTSTSVVMKNTTAAFSLAGSSATVGISTSSNMISLSLASTTSIGNGVMTAGPSLASGTLDDGGHAILRVDGKYLVINGNGTAATNIYDPVANTFTAGPSLSSGTVQHGGHSIQRPDGKFLVINANNTATTNIYDPIANTFSSGPSLASSEANFGSHSIQRPDGKFLIINAKLNAVTNIYDPIANSFSAGPSLATSTAYAGSHSIQRPDGKFLIINGHQTAATNIYDPIANTFVAGPILATGTAYTGSHSIQRPDGKFLVINGNFTTNTNIYDPVANTFTAGPSLTTVANHGSHSIQRPDGKWLIVSAGSGSTSDIYDPVTNTMSAGPNLASGAAHNGGFSIQRPDGKFLIVNGYVSSTTNIYDPSYVMSGVYESEDMLITDLNPSSVLNFTTNGEGKIEVAIKTATSTAALAASYTTYATTTSGSKITPVAGAQYAKVRVTLTRPIPTNRQPMASAKEKNTWLGESEAKYHRTFANPILYSFNISNQKGYHVTNADFGTYTATTTPGINATSSGPVTSNLLAGGNGLSFPYELAYLQDGGKGQFIQGTSTLNNMYQGSFTIQRPDGKFLTFIGNTTATTNLYDPASNSFTAGPSVNSGTLSYGAHAFQRPDGKFFVVNGGTGTVTNIYDPITNTFIAGPALTGNAGNGSHSLQRPDGKFLIIHGNNGTATTLYDPIANTVTPGPTLVNAVNLSGHTVPRPDGKFLIVNAAGGSGATNIYDPVTNTVVAGAGATAGIYLGALSVQRPDGKWLLVVGNDTNSTSIYDPTAGFGASMTSGPTMTGTVGYGSQAIQRADGRYLIIHGGAQTTTTIYDPISNTSATGPTLPFAITLGSHAFQRPDGKFVIFRGNSTADSVVYDPGYNLRGYYESEFINDQTLDSNSVLVWKGNADAYKNGVVSMRVRTATSTDALQTASWRTFPVSGSRINPGTGEVWVQVKIEMNRNIPQQAGVSKNVWQGGEGITVYSRQPLFSSANYQNQAQTFVLPTIYSYAIQKQDGQDFANFALNGQSIFRFSATGDAYTSNGGTWNAGGADLAEFFPVGDDILEPGDVVSITKDANGLVAMTTESYDDTLLGIVATAPGLRLGSDDLGNVNKQPIALAGRVPVKVSLEGGVIKKGDYLTSASRPGYAMKATGAGRVVGIALEDYTLEMDTANNGNGKVLVFVNPHFYMGSTLSAKVGSLFSRFAYMVREGMGELGVTIADNGNVGIGVAAPLSRFQVNGDIRLGVASSTSGAVIFQNAANGYTTTLRSSTSSLTSNLTFTLPDTLGTASQALTTDGEGNLSFKNVAVLTGTSTANQLLRFLDDGTVTNSSITDEGGAITIRGSASSSPLRILSSTDESLFTLDQDGNVAIRGSITTSSANVATRYLEEEPLVAGDIVTFSTSTATSTTIRKSLPGEEAIGIVATSSGIILGSTEGTPVALTGSVLVNVSNENGDINQGDYLTISTSAPGYAMKLTENGFSLGRALTSSATTSTSSLVLVSLELRERAIILSGIEGLDFVDASSTLPTLSMRETLTLRLSLGYSVVKEYVAVRVSAVTGYFDTLFAKDIYTDTICIKKSDGTNVCFNGDQIEDVLNASNIPLLENTPQISGTTSEEGLPPVGATTSTSSDETSSNDEVVTLPEAGDGPVLAEEIEDVSSATEQEAPSENSQPNETTPSVEE